MNTPQLPNFKPSAMKENKSGNPANLLQFSDSTKDSLDNQVARIIYLYQLGRIRGPRAHEMLHDCTTDLGTIYWAVSGTIGRAHNCINIVHRIRNSRESNIFPDGRNYLSKQTASALDRVLRTSRDCAEGRASYKEFRDLTRIAQQLMKQDVRTLCQDLSDLVYKIKRTPVRLPSLRAADLGYKPDEVLTNEQPEMEEMLIKKVSL